jgi:predicted transcriptional regulator of viral defense system
MSRTVAIRESIAAPPVDQAIAALAARQHGLAKTRQLLACGLDHSAIHRRVKAGRLHRRSPGVYAIGHPALSREGEWLAAVFGAGEGAALSHLSAAELWQLRRRRSSLIAVVAPARRRLAGVRVHTYRSLHPRDVTTHRGIPVTTIPRLLVDLTDVLIAHELANVIHEAAFRGRFSLAATQDAIARANGRHNLPVLERAIAMHEAGSAGLKSRNERTFLALLEDLPEPLVNTPLHGFEVDFHWPALKLAVEVDGPGHARPRTQRDDANRDRTLTAAGYTTLRFTDDDLDHRPAWVAAAIRAACGG